MCCCLLRLGFLPWFTGIFVSPRLPAQPAAALLLSNAPSRSRTRGYKVILLQRKTGQETIILPQPFLDGAQGICCCNSDFLARPNLQEKSAHSQEISLERPPRNYLIPTISKTSSQKMIPDIHTMWFPQAAAQKDKGWPYPGRFWGREDAQGDLQCHCNAHSRSSESTSMC